MLLLSALAAFAAIAAEDRSPARAGTALEISGTVLPFRVHSAIRNAAFGGGEVRAQVTVAVQGGTSGDWIATAVHLARESIVGGATDSDVVVFLDNPWGYAPPQQYKKLARAIYQPDPSHRPSGERWQVFAAERLPTAADIEHDVLTADLYDPDRRAQRRPKESPEQAARRIVIERHGLPPTWNPTPGLGTRGPPRDGESIRVSMPPDLEARVDEVRRCLTSTKESLAIHGCRVPSR